MKISYLNSAIQQRLLLYRRRYERGDKALKRNKITALPLCASLSASPIGTGEPMHTLL
ncbi:MAG: hypothetical protein KME30_11255 [Iphinoe sp. HA4291-MV1]|nr:hypothetical protein [Iphinoe sp. HA4291-MV1]